MSTTFNQWAIKQHADTNHMYDKYLPYEFHLRMVNEVRKEFQDKYLKPITIKSRSGERYNLSLTTNSVIERILECACFGHDILEDTRVSYSDLVKALSSTIGNDDTCILVADLIRSVTNYSRGRNRDERMPDYIYQEMKEQQYGVFIKLCDRIANVQYGILTKSSMTKKYRDELPKFKKSLYTEGEYEDMWLRLEMLLGVIEKPVSY